MPRTDEKGVEIEKSSPNSLSSMLILGKVGREIGLEFSILLFNFCVSL